MGSGKDLALRFTGLRRSPDSYTPRNIYWLSSNAQSPEPQPAAPAPRPSPTPAAAIAQTTLTLEEDRQYDTLAEKLEDRWYWQSIFAPATVEIPFVLANLGEGAGELGMYVIAKTSAPVDPDHRLLVSINGTLVTDAPWDGAEAKWLAAPIAPGILKEGDNTLTINAPGTGAPADLVQLQRVEIRHPTKGETAAIPRPPAAVVAVKPGSLPDWPGGADLVIVTAPQFRDALQPLVAAREKQGLRVAVLEADLVYDAFSFGQNDPAAIRALMRHAWEKWTGPAPRYLLLAGDASYDPLGYTQGAESDIIPTQVVRTAFSGWNGSDVWYALADDQPTALPAFAVGRFPAQTPEQLATMVSKTLAYEAEGEDIGWRSKALLVADNDEPGFADETSAFAKALPPYTSELVTIEGDGANAREALDRGFDEGSGLIGYFGHGSIPLWAKENVFDVKDAAKLQNKRLPIVFTVTCLSGFFEHPSTVSLGETLLRQPGGGAVAALMPSRRGRPHGSKLARAGSGARPGGAGPPCARRHRARGAAQPARTGGQRARHPADLQFVRGSIDDGRPLAAAPANRRARGPGR